MLLSLLQLVFPAAHNSLDGLPTVILFTDALEMKCCAITSLTFLVSATGGFGWQQPTHICACSPWKSCGKKPAIVHENVLQSIQAKSKPIVGSHSAVCDSSSRRKRLAVVSFRQSLERTAPGGYNLRASVIMADAYGNSDRVSYPSGPCRTHTQTDRFETKVSMHAHLSSRTMRSMHTTALPRAYCHHVPIVF